MTTRNYAELPKVKGAYALLYTLQAQTRLRIGRLGWFDFSVERMVYTGSALGSGGLASRLGHHLRREAAPHWHADYLGQSAQLLGVCWTETDQRLECAWSRRLASLAGAFIPASGFGASDCREGCPAHLVGFGFELDLPTLVDILQCGCQGKFGNLFLLKTGL